MPVNLNRENPPIGAVAFRWTVREYEKHARDKRWYFMFGILGLSLLAYAVLTNNYLFALIISLFAIILFLQSIQEPLEVDFGITETGIVVGSKYYPYSELNKFWIIYNPPEVKNLYFLTNQLIRHRIQVPLLDNDPRPIREFLGLYVLEDLDQEEEPLSDRLGRVFKLH